MDSNSRTNLLTSLSHSRLLPAISSMVRSMSTDGMITMDEKFIKRKKKGGFGQLGAVRSGSYNNLVGIGQGQGVGSFQGQLSLHSGQVTGQVRPGQVVGQENPGQAPGQTVAGNIPLSPKQSDENFHKTNQAYYFPNGEVFRPRMIPSKRTRPGKVNMAVATQSTSASTRSQPASRSGSLTSQHQQTQQFLQSLNTAHTQTKYNTKRGSQASLQSNNLLKPSANDELQKRSSISRKAQRNSVISQFGKSDDGLSTVYQSPAYSTTLSRYDSDPIDSDSESESESPLPALSEEPSHTPTTSINTDEQTGPSASINRLSLSVSSDDGGVPEGYNPYTRVFSESRYSYYPQLDPGEDPIEGALEYYDAPNDLTPTRDRDTGESTPTGETDTGDSTPTRETEPTPTRQYSQESQMLSAESQMLLEESMRLSEQSRMLSEQSQRLSEESQRLSEKSRARTQASLNKLQSKRRDVSETKGISRIRSIPEIKPDTKRQVSKELESSSKVHSEHSEVKRIPAGSDPVELRSADNSILHETLDDSFGSDTPNFNSTISSIVEDVLPVKVQRSEVQRSEVQKTQAQPEKVPEKAHPVKILDEKVQPVKVLDEKVQHADKTQSTAQAHTHSSALKQAHPIAPQSTQTEKASKSETVHPSITEKVLDEVDNNPSISDNFRPPRSRDTSKESPKARLNSVSSVGSVDSLDVETFKTDPSKIFHDSNKSSNSLDSENDKTSESFDNSDAMSDTMSSKSAEKTARAKGIVFKDIKELRRAFEELDAKKRKADGPVKSKLNVDTKILKREVRKNEKPSKIPTFDKKVQTMDRRSAEIKVAVAPQSAPVKVLVEGPSVVTEVEPLQSEEPTVTPGVLPDKLKNQAPIEEPATVVPVKEPATVVPVKEPATVVPVKEPATVVPVKEPATAPVKVISEVLIKEETQTPVKSDTETPSAKVVSDVPENVAVVNAESKVHETLKVVNAEKVPETLKVANAVLPETVKVTNAESKPEAVIVPGPETVNGKSVQVSAKSIPAVNEKPGPELKHVSEKPSLSLNLPAASSPIEDTSMRYSPGVVKTTILTTSARISKDSQYERAQILTPSRTLQESHDPPSEQIYSTIPAFTQPEHLTNSELTLPSPNITLTNLHDYSGANISDRLRDVMLQFEVVSPSESAFPESPIESSFFATPDPQKAKLKPFLPQSLLGFETPTNVAFPVEMRTPVTNTSNLSPIQNDNSDWKSELKREKNIQLELIAQMPKSLKQKISSSRLRVVSGSDDVKQAKKEELRLDRDDFIGRSEREEKLRLLESGRAERDDSAGRSERDERIRILEAASRAAAEATAELTASDLRAAAEAQIRPLHSLSSFTSSEDVRSKTSDNSRKTAETARTSETRTSRQTSYDGTRKTSHEETRTSRRTSRDETRTSRRTSRDEPRTTRKASHDETRTSRKTSHDETRTSRKTSHDETRTSRKTSHDETRERTKPRADQDQIIHSDPSLSGELSSDREDPFVKKQRIVSMLPDPTIDYSSAHSPTFEKLLKPVTPRTSMIFEDTHRIEEALNDRAVPQRGDLRVANSQPQTPSGIFTPDTGYAYAVSPESYQTVPPTPPPKPDNYVAKAKVDEFVAPPMSLPPMISTPPIPENERNGSTAPNFKGQAPNGNNPPNGNHAPNGYNPPGSYNSPNVNGPYNSPKANGYNSPKVNGTFGTPKGGYNSPNVNGSYPNIHGYNSPNVNNANGYVKPTKLQTEWKAPDSRDSRNSPVPVHSSPTIDSPGEIRYNTPRMLDIRRAPPVPEFRQDLKNSPTIGTKATDFSHLISGPPLFPPFAHSVISLSSKSSSTGSLILPEKIPDRTPAKKEPALKKKRSMLDVVDAEKPRSVSAPVQTLSTSSLAKVPGIIDIPPTPTTPNHLNPKVKIYTMVNPKEARARVQPTSSPVSEAGNSPLRAAAAGRNISARSNVSMPQMPHRREPSKLRKEKSFSELNAHVPNDKKGIKTFFKKMFQPKEEVFEDEESILSATSSQNRQLDHKIRTQQEEPLEYSYANDSVEDIISVIEPLEMLTELPTLELDNLFDDMLHTFDDITDQDDPDPYNYFAKQPYLHIDEPESVIRAPSFRPAAPQRYSQRSSQRNSRRHSKRPISEEFYIDDNIRFLQQEFVNWSNLEVEDFETEDVVANTELERKCWSILVPPDEDHTVVINNDQLDYLYNTLSAKRRRALPGHLKFLKQFKDFSHVEVDMRTFDLDTIESGALAPIKVTEAGKSTLRRHGPGQKRRAKNVNFDTKVFITETFPAEMYQRYNKLVTQYTLTEGLEINKIKNELNNYKCHEMLVHESSQKNTHFFY